MVNKIIQSLEKPLLYQKTAGEFWNDEHISKQMLKAHLDPEFEGASRKLSFIDKSAAWIKDTIPPTSYPLLLDMGCGPGLYAEKFAQYGYKVTGIDFSHRAIEYARNSALKQGLHIKYLFQDYLEMSLQETFDFITMIYCDYGALSTDDRKKLLRIIYQHLKPGGKLLLDVFSKETFDSFREGQTWESCPSGGFWREHGYIALSGHYKYQDLITLEQTTIISDAEIATYYIWNTCFTQNSLIEEVKKSGFNVSGIFENVAGEKSHQNSPTIAILLEK